MTQAHLDVTTATVRNSRPGDPPSQHGFRGHLRPGALASAAGMREQQRPEPSGGGGGGRGEEVVVVFMGLEPDKMAGGGPLAGCGLSKPQT